MAFSKSLFAAICLIGLIYGTEAYKCYKCESTASATDSCAVNATTQKQESCGAVGTKCVVERVSDIDGKFISIERGCALKVTWLGAASKCGTTDKKTTCLVICESDLCNDVVESKVDDCAKKNCKYSSASLPGIMNALLLMFAVMATKFSL